MSKNKEVITEHEYRLMQINYAIQLMDSGLTPEEAREKLNIPESVSLKGLAMMMKME